MEKLFFLSTFIVLFFSCKKDDGTAKKQNSSQNNVTEMGLVSTDVHLDTDIPLTYENYVCNGAMINFTGTIHVTYNARPDGKNTIGTQHVTTALTGVSRNGVVYKAMESSMDKTIITSSDFLDKHAVTGSYFEQGHANSNGLYKYLLVYKYDSQSQKISVTIQDFQLVCGG